MTKAEKAKILAREKALAAYINSTSGKLNPESLSRSYGMSIKRVNEFLKSYGRL